jgi:hypothetical protein
VVIALKNPLPALIPTRALPASVDGDVPTGLIAISVALVVAVAVTAIALYRRGVK